MFLLTPSSSRKRDILRTGKVPREYMPGLGGLVVHQTQLVQGHYWRQSGWWLGVCMGSVEINYVRHNT